MRSIRILALASVVVAVPAAASPRDSDVLAVEARIAKAQMAKDVTAFGRLLAAEHVFTLPDGKIVSRAQQLKDLATWWSPSLVAFSGQSVRRLGKAAVVTGRARYRWQTKGKPPEEAIEQYTDTYVRRGGRWLRLASHSSCISGRCT